MTIIEAIKSGKPFKLPGQAWSYAAFTSICNGEPIYFCLKRDSEMLRSVFSISNILRDDWQLDEEKKVELTKFQILEALFEEMKADLEKRKFVVGQTNLEHIASCFEPVLKRLGFS